MATRNSISEKKLAQQQMRRAYAVRIKDVICYIENHLDDDLSLDRLSQIAHFSAFHFHRQFTAFSGITVARLVRLLRLKRATTQLAFTPEVSITDVALNAGFENPESFSRAFKKWLGQSPSEFRRAPLWPTWPKIDKESTVNTEVELIEFPTTKVAAVEYCGLESQSYSATMKLVAWRRENGVSPDKGRTYGVHYSDPTITAPEDYRLDVCVSFDAEILPNNHGVIAKVITGGRCARIRHLGSRQYIAEAEYLYREWLPASGETPRDEPLIFHYVNVGPNVEDKDMVTDVYLPLR